MRNFLEALRLLIELHPRHQSEKWPQLCLRFVVGCLDLIRRSHDDSEKFKYAEDALQVVDDLLSAGVKGANISVG